MDEFADNVKVQHAYYEMDAVAAGRGLTKCRQAGYSQSINMKNLRWLVKQSYPDWGRLSLPPFQRQMNLWKHSSAWQQHPSRGHVPDPCLYPDPYPSPDL